MDAKDLRSLDRFGQSLATEQVAARESPVREIALGRVMMVDDDDVDHMLYHRIIRRHARVTELISHTDPTVALAHICSPTNPKVDLILLDINMPRLTGFEFLDAATERLGPDLNGIKVVMLTTSLDPRDRLRGCNHPAVRAFVNKPLRATHLAEIAKPGPVTDLSD